MIFVCIHVTVTASNIRVASLYLDENDVATRLSPRCQKFDCPIDADIGRLERTKNACSICRNLSD
jgi:hypothetical protein